MNREKTTSAVNSINDSDLVRSFKEGNQIAFERLVIKYQDRIFNLCFRFLGDRNEAEDTAQEVFIKVYKALKRFRSESSFYTWIYRITVNTCKNRVKSLDYRRSKKNITLDDEKDSKFTSAPYASGMDENPDQIIVKKERIKQVQNAIKDLTSDHRAVIILRDIEGFSYEEISEITGHKLGTVKSRLSRARNDLRTILKGID
ncbi:RNA polymerase sigma factor [Thermodesulfobacteriota bacterium]